MEFEEQDDVPHTRLARLRSLTKTAASSPIRSFLFVVPLVFAADFLAAWVLDEWRTLSGPTGAFIDAAVDLAVVVPLLLVLFVLPAAQHIREREASERALRAAREDLGRRVLERTTELKESNQQLQREAAERGRAQKALTFQASLLDAAEEAVVATDQDDRIVYWNRFAERLYGWTAEEAKSRHLQGLGIFRSAAGTPLDLPKECGECTSWSGEIDAVRRDQSHFAAYVVCSPLNCGERGYVFVSVDISKLAAAVAAVEESEKKYSSLVENVPTGIFIVHQGRLAFANPKLAEITGYERGDELLGLDPLSLVHEEDRAEIASIAAKRAAGTPVPEQHEYRLVTRTGEVRWVSVQGTLIPYRGDFATLATLQDVTDRRRMEAEVRRLSARLVTIQEEERRRLARDLHDSVGQTLTGIKFLVEAALGDEWPEERRSGVQSLRALIPSIQEAVEEVRRISTELRPALLDDLGLLPTIDSLLRDAHRARPKITVEHDFKVTEARIPKDLRTPIFRVLQEAVNNVLKHSQAARLVVSLEEVDQALHLRVRDDGIGFDRHGLPRGHGQWGSGLSSMQERAELAGGTFAISSSPGAGTTIDVVWPLKARVSA